MRDATDTDADIAAIEAVIEADIRAYLAKDRAAWARQWVHSDDFVSVMECSGLMVRKGYTPFEEGVFASMDTADQPSAARVTRDDMRVHIHGDSAWAYFEQKLEHSADPMDPAAFSHNVRILERHPDGWRIVFHGTWSPHVSDLARPMIEVDAEARVLWQNGAAKARLPDFPGLTISHDRLRGTRPDWDKELRRTIGRAAKLQTYAAINAAQGKTGEAIRYPVVLGEDDEARLVICWVEISDYRVFVSFSDAQTMDRRVEIAGMMLGLSDAQTRLAREIAEGHDLTTAAEHMGITPNSARTHLKRMFAKTNVTSQTALIRLILSSA